MPNPLNPLDWLKSAQDWFSETERSSGFRPYLIFLILVFGMGICLLSFFGDVAYANEIGLGLIIVSVVVFILLYCLKAFIDPDFCRSEHHVQKIMRIELETMGNEGHQLEGQVVELEMLEEATKEPTALLSDGNQPSEEESEQ